MNGPGTERFVGPVPCVSGFCIENAPATNWLRGIAGVSQESLWAVGDGALLHFDGSRWDTACAPLERWMLHTAYADAHGGVWIAGRATAGHFDGVTWRATAVDPGAYIFEIWGDASEAFAAHWGVPAGILRWDGLSWSRSYGGLYASDLSVWGNGSGRAWGADGGLLVAWDGARWTEQPRPFNLMDVWAPAGGDPWFAGNTFRWPESWIHDAAVATQVAGDYVTHPLPGYWEARWVRGSGPEDVWVGATSSPSGDILRWDGASWHVLPSPDAGYWQVPLVLGPRDAWVVENPYDATFTRTFARVAHFDGASWSESLTIDAPRVAAVTTTPGDVWAASDVGLWRFDGARWSSMHERMGYAVQLAADGDQVWVVSEDAESGSATVVMWDGSRIRTHRLPGAPTALHAVAGHAWIATRGSTSDGSNAVVHHWDGASWNALDTGATMSVQDVWASGPNDLWVVGAILPVSWTSQTGVIGHWDGEGWVRREAKDFGYTAVWGTGPSDVWLSGDTDYCQKCPPVPPEPTLLRWDGARLTRAASIAFDEITGSGAEHVWAISTEFDSSAGHVAVLHRFDGARWTATTRLEEPFRPYGLHVAADGTLWGADGRILHRRP